MVSNQYIKRDGLRNRIVNVDNNTIAIITKDCKGGDNGVFFIDSEDYTKVRDIKWSNSKGYACNTKLKKRLHHIIMDTTNIVDHIDRNTYNNRKSNLRIADKQLNAMNCKVSKNSTTRINGVSFDKRSGKYEAYLCLDYKKKSLGKFDTLEDARLSRLEAETEWIKRKLNETHVWKTAKASSK